MKDKEGVLGRVVPKAGDRTPLCSKRKSQRKSSEPVPWWKQHFFWKLEEPDSGSSSAINCLVILGASSPTLGSSFLIQ